MSAQSNAARDEKVVSPLNGVGLDGAAGRAQMLKVHSGPVVTPHEFSATTCQVCGPIASGDVRV